MKEGISIKPISKNEALYLRKKGHSKYVHNGHGTYSRYYVTQSEKVLEELEKYRTDIKK